MVKFKIVFFWVFFFVSLLSHSIAVEPEKVELSESGQKSLAEIYTRYKSGSYDGALNLIKKLEKEYKGKNKEKLEGLLNYWKGIIYNRLQYFEESKTSFKKALSLGHKPNDIYYEFAQSLYALDELKKSRHLFMKSALNGYRPAISLYYVAFISQTIGDYRLAVKAYRRIEKLKDEEKASVLQASRMQVADIYLTAVDKQKNQVEFLQERVLSEFENALLFDPDSILAKDIRRKVLKLKDKYGLILLKLRNGRPTVFPRRFIKLTQEFGQDTNAISTGDPTSTALGSTMYSYTDFYVRRAYYSGNSVSLSPELKANFTYYTNSATDIRELNNYTYTPALRTTQEHTLFGKPASFLIDYEFNRTETNIDNNGYTFNSDSSTYMFGHRSNFMKYGESIFRYKFKDLTSYLNSSTNSTRTYSYEQVWNLGDGYILLSFLTYAKTRYTTEGNASDVNTLTSRMDFILPRVFNYATPTLSYTYTSADYFNNTDRGNETTHGLGLKFTRVISKKRRANLALDYSSVDSATATYTYDKTKLSFNMEFLF